MGPSDIISRIGAGAVEAATHANPAAVAKWRSRGIPAKFWPAIVRSAATHEATKDITLDVIERAHAAPQGAE